MVAAALALVVAAGTAGVAPREPIGWRCRLKESPSAIFPPCLITTARSTGEGNLCRSDVGWRLVKFRSPCASGRLREGRSEVVAGVMVFVCLLGVGTPIRA